MNIYLETDPQTKAKISSEILADLPEWFGLPESTAEYIANSQKLPMFVAATDTQAVGFLTLRTTSQKTAEIDCMGLLKKYHQQGIGQKLIVAAMKWCRQNRIDFLQVKTLADTHPDENYAKTRKFYQKAGFTEVETFPTLWGEANPCLQMIRKVATNDEQTNL